MHPGHESYAHGLLRVTPGLDFSPECDAEVCSDFDETDPSIPCLMSCANYFVPRLKPEQSFQPESGVCAGESFIECYGTLDADFG
ncbi:MAG: hypothetical protein QF464_18185, partial [Myxococcota bacterium]|nr:hypothetical protein [Myxococcota bacterium]